MMQGQKHDRQPMGVLRCLVSCLPSNKLRETVGGDLQTSWGEKQSKRLVDHLPATVWEVVVVAS